MFRYPLRRSRARLLALAATLAAVMPGAPAHAQGPITSLTLFGDSFSDTGNAFQLSGFPPAPYVNGRFSNGDVFGDYLARLLGRPGDATPAFAARLPSGNYAIGASRTVDAVVNVPGLGPQTVPGTASQIAQYALVPGRTFDPTGLYVLFAGANDVRDAGGLGTDAARRAAAQTAALNIAAQANQLALLGARSILLPLLPNLGLIPEAALIPGRSAILTELTSVFNTTLATGIAGLRAANPTTQFYELTTNNLYTNILADVQRGGGVYGFVNASIPCLPGFQPPGVPAPPCAVSVFADPLHPTTRVHELLANAAYNRVVNNVDIAVVPEPSTVILLATGLLTIAGVAGRRARR